MDAMAPPTAARLCVLSVHAHPDDEASKGAATMARYHDEGVRTVLVTCTGGEAGDILNPEADTEDVRADLAAVRMRELDDAVRIIGYDELYLLGYRDSGMPDTEPNAHPDNFANADLDEATGRLVEIVRAERPQVIVGYAATASTRTPTTCGCTRSACWRSSGPATPSGTPSSASRGSR